MTRVLLIEDEESLRQVIQLNLELENYEVITSDNGQDAIDKLNGQYFDLVILDLMIPKINGIEVLRSLRVQNKKTPVIIISAKNTSSDRINGLKVGADDYLSKPFEIEELTIRIEKLISRNQRPTQSIPDIYSFGDNTINFQSFSGIRNQTTYDLSQKEIHIIRYLIMNKGQVVSRQDILKNVWGYDVFPSTRTIDNFIAAIRKRVESDPKNPKHIISIRGIGYKFLDQV